MHPLTFPYTGKQSMRNKKHIFEALWILICFLMSGSSVFCSLVFKRKSCVRICGERPPNTLKHKKKFKLLQVDIKNKSNTELESWEVALLHNHWCWSFFMKIKEATWNLQLLHRDQPFRFDLHCQYQPVHLLFLGELPRVILVIQVIKIQG